jgi:hypothetical protein
MVGMAVEARLILGTDPAEIMRYYLEDNDLTDKSGLLDEVTRCIEAMPPWFWDITGAVAEDKIEVSYRRAPDEVVIVGKPDFWYVETAPDGSPLAIQVIELKTCNEYGPGTEKKLLGYSKYGAQPTRYAVLIRDKYPELDELPIFRRHVVLSRKGSGVSSPQFQLSTQAISNARSDMVALAWQVVDSAPIHHFGPLCGWCPFEQVCQSYVNGQEPLAILEEHYERRGHG